MLFLNKWKKNLKLTWKSRRFSTLQCKKAVDPMGTCTKLWLDMTSLNLGPGSGVVVLIVLP